MSNALENQIKLADILTPAPGASTATLQAALDACAASGQRFVGAAGSYTLTATLVINCPVDMTAMEMTVASSSVSPAIRVGTITGATAQINGQVNLPRLSNSTKPTTGWAGQGTGIELANLYETEVYVPYVYGFAVGLDCGGYTSGFSYNTVRLGMISTNKVGVRLQGKNDATGWANQNTFLNGRIFIPSSEGTAISGTRYLQMVPLDVATSASTTWPNGNTFIGTTFESDEAEFQAEIAGNNNVFMNCRWEAVTPAVKFTGHASVTCSYENLIVGGYKASSIAFTRSGVSPYSGLINPRVSSLSGSDVVMNLRNEGSGTYPILQGFDAGVEHLNRASDATDWNFRLSASQLLGKASGDVNPRVTIDFLTGQFRLLTLANYTNDANAAAGGIPIGGFYRNASAVQVRVA
jgi:hypothetical protein